MNWVALYTAWKQSRCGHRFAVEDLRLVNPDSEGTDRVEWSCSVCGKSFEAHCGLDISPKNGFTYRRDVQ